MNYRAQAAQIANDPAASFWLKAAIIAANNRDPVDALHDARALLAFCTAKVQEALTA